MLALYISLLDTEEQISKFEHIYTKYRGLMFYTAKGVLQDSYLAEDAVHETFLDIIRIIDSIRANNEKELSQFLRVLTHHKAVDMVRKCTRQKKSDTEIEDLDLSKSDVNVETIVLDKIDYENMLLLVQSMDEKYKTPLLLKVQGYKVSEIADFLNISPGNVKVRLHRARKIILTGLEENGNDDDKIRISPDALIAMIVTEAQDRELARMPSLEEMNEDFQPSEKFQRKMEALVRDTKRKAERKKRLLNVKRFFITLTAAISIFSCTMLPVKAVREAVITTLIEWHDKFVSIIYVNEESPVSTFHITPSYIPSGFSQIESSGESTGRYYGQFQNSEGDWFSLRVLPVENSQVTSLDSEFSSYYSISFDNNQAIWGIMDDDSNTLLWESSTLSFQVRGNLSITELIKISEGIEIQ